MQLLGYEFNIFINEIVTSLQELLSNSSAFNESVNSSSFLLDRSRNDERLTGRSRGWLNWLSLGMLGAGGTDDSSQFSGVVSDEVIQVPLLPLEKRQIVFQKYRHAIYINIYFIKSIYKGNLHFVFTSRTYMRQQSSFL